MLVAITCSLLAMGLGCGGGGGQPKLDAAMDFAPVDVAAMPDAGPKPLSLDFSATGCTTTDPIAQRCAGVAPLTLTFTPIASEGLTRFLWTFGDKTPSSSERSPRHTYTVPGKYDVTLTAGGSSELGSIQKSRVEYVHVELAPIGAACDVDSQCATMSCWCGSAAPCTPVLTRGLCGQRCDDEAGGPTACPELTVCADLSAAGAVPLTVPPSADGWRRPLCLAACGTDDDCPDGFRCRDLLAGQPVTVRGWVRACFANYPLPIGARCGDPTGKPVDADCASRTCADLGAFRRCSADCGAIGCPPGTTCAHFGDGRNLCLAACGGGTICNDDPLLACEAPGSKGPLGFAVANDPVAQAATYCAPKRCTTGADCGPAGSCPSGGGNCARK
jgi:PKD repeat protein